MSFSFGKLLPQAASNLLSSASTRVAEAASAAVTTLGGNGTFTKVAARADSLQQQAAGVVQQASALRTTSEDLRTTIGREMSSMMANNAVANNAMALSQAIANLTQSAGAAYGSMLSRPAVDAGDDSHIVKLQEPNGATVLFRIMPEVTEQRAVEYEAVAPPQHPGAFQKYKGTSSVQWSVTATLTCATTAEATENLRILNVLRGWTMPFFGQRTGEQFPTKLGAPPPVLKFSGFRKQMIGPVPVVLTSCQWQFPRDVDYIPAEEFTALNSVGSVVARTGQMVPFPTVMTVSLQLVESYSTEQFNGFSLMDFRVGQTEAAFRPVSKNANVTNNPRQGVGVLDPAEPAQHVFPNAQTFQGRSTGVGGYTAEEIAANSVSANANYGNEHRRSAPAARRGGTITELRRAAYVASEIQIRTGSQDSNTSQFRSEGGGDFGGGGSSSASGDW